MAVSGGDIETRNNFKKYFENYVFPINNFVQSNHSMIEENS